MSRETWEWDEEPKRLIYCVYEFWVREHRAPNTAELCRVTGFSPRQCRSLLRQLQEGFAVSFADERVNLVIDKAPPFSSTPTSIVGFVEGEFLGFIGCPMEVVTVGILPMLEHTTIELRCHCACCLEPINLQMHGNELVGSTPSVPLIVAVRSPWDWEHGVTPDRVCDSFHYALDAEHARRFERQVLRRGVTMTFEQVERIAKFAGEGRMRDPHWKAIRQDAARMLQSWSELGVDVEPWR